MISRKYTLGILSLVLGTVGCAEDYNSLQIVHNQARTIEDECVLEPDVEAPYIPHGFADLKYGGYELTPLLRSGLTALENDPNNRTIAVTRATTLIRPVATTESRAAVDALADAAGATRYLAANVEPGGLTTVSFQAIDGQQANILAGAITTPVEVLVRVVVIGEAAGTEVRSAPFEYPITLCNGCSEVDIGACSLYPVGQVAIDGCYIGQDALVPCCTSDAGAAVCPAIGTKTT